MFSIINDYLSDLMVHRAIIIKVLSLKGSCSVAKFSLNFFFHSNAPNNRYVFLQVDLFSVYSATFLFIDRFSSISSFNARRLETIKNAVYVHFNKKRRSVCLCCVHQDLLLNSMRAQRYVHFYANEGVTFHFCCMKIRYTMRNKLQ